MLREASDKSALANELQEESDKFRFLRAWCFANLKGRVGLIMEKTSVMRITIPVDLSSRCFIPIPRFIRSCRPTPLLVPSLVLFPPCSASVVHVECIFWPFIGLCAHHRFNVTPFFPWPSSFFILLEINNNIILSVCFRLSLTFVLIIVLVWHLLSLDLHLFLFFRK